MKNQRVKKISAFQTIDGMDHESRDKADRHADWLQFKQWIDSNYETHYKAGVIRPSTGGLFKWLKKHAKDIPWELFDDDVKPNTRKAALTERVKYLEGTLRQIQRASSGTPDYDRADVWDRCQEALYSGEDK